MPFRVSVSVDDAANPFPLIVTNCPGLTAVKDGVIDGVTVKVKVAALPGEPLGPPDTVIVCAPATKFVSGILKPDSVVPV